MMLGEAQTAFELDRGHQNFEDGERGSVDWLTGVDGRPSAIAPCPPVPAAHVEAVGSYPTTALDAAGTSRRALVLVVGGIAVFALAAFVATGGRDGSPSSSSADTVAGAGLVDSVIAPSPMAVRRPASTLETSSETSRHHRAGTHDRSKSGSDGSDGDSSSGGSGGGTGGGGDGGGGSDEPTPLATVNLPVVGTVTVDEPNVPPLPDVKVPDLAEVQKVPDVPTTPKLP